MFVRGGRAIKPHSLQHRRKTQHKVVHEQLEKINTHRGNAWRYSHLGSKHDDVKLKSRLFFGTLLTALRCFEM